MKFEEKLKKLPHSEIWQEYCGFLDMSMEEYMSMQKRLLMEEIEMMSKCELGKIIMGDEAPKTVEEFREKVPLTTYDDYANVLLLKRENMLCQKPVVWLSTTWEGGDFPAKVAPYCESMLSVYTHNLMASAILATSLQRGKFNIRSNARALYALAPLPYATGLVPDLMGPQIKFQFLPPIKEARKLSFSQQSKKGFELGIKYGMELFFGMSSIVYIITKSFDSVLSGGKGSLKTAFQMSPTMLFRMLAAKYKSKRDQRPIMPKDLFKLDGFVCVGTDSALYKNELTEAWGIKPLEMAGGTEPTCMGTETWSKDGLVFFPDACFYEFIPEDEMLKNLKDPSYKPKIYLMDEIRANQNYEIVVTVLKGGAFLRYRVGDIYRCLRTYNPRDNINIPQFEYVDRVPNVIDIAGFTRISEKEINKVINLSGLPIYDWCAIKEYDKDNHSFLHMYVEMMPGAEARNLVSKKIIKEHLSIYFRYYDGDYSDLKRFLGMDPLRVTMLKTGTIESYKDKYSEDIPKINPKKEELTDLLRLGSLHLGEGDDD